VELFSRRKLKQDLQAGIGFHPDGISVAVVKRQTGGRSTLQNMRFQPYNDSESYSDVCGKIASELDLRSMKSVLVLPPDDYSMLQVESPGVEPAELRGAVRWQIKDLIDFHIDDATIDLFALPEPKRAGVSGKLSVVAARNSLIQNRVDLLGGAGIEIEAIDITELALRNLALLENSNSGNGAHAILYLSPGYGMIEVINDSQLYLSRQIKVNLKDLEQVSSSAEGEWGNPVLDNLVLEIQRSMDFYESQFGEGPVQRVSVMPCSADAVDGLLQFAQNNLEAAVGMFELKDMLDGMDSMPQDTISNCLVSLGAALRGAT
jgi:MSHA biogenesis protein MshI